MVTKLPEFFLKLLHMVLLITKHFKSPVACHSKSTLKVTAIDKILDDKFNRDKTGSSFKFFILNTRCTNSFLFLLFLQVTHTISWKVKMSGEASTIFCFIRTPDRWKMVSKPLILQNKTDQNDSISCLYIVYSTLGSQPISLALKGCRIPPWVSLMPAWLGVFLNWLNTLQ